MLSEVFDFELLRNFLKRSDFSFVFDALWAVTGAYASPIFVDTLGAEPSVIRWAPFLLLLAVAQYSHHHVISSRQHSWPTVEQSMAKMLTQDVRSIADVVRCVQLPLVKKILMFIILVCNIS